ncbi:GTPase [Arthrobacter crystallopoietes]|uniref:GTP-binding protein EngB required for normal cell division n=1 Tax=Crystallibacter crystallopoietes TaxID=37928 RepID=A0A1H1G3Y0_9MICC|nr:GTPase [Arthrobacter crystallopoietes]AUI52788.1 ABC transporter [Arthrobacter crystallopoietes]SDR07628.1 GTP-binding protein EngB required for normal cell division [Arthrobacter crystallopoietes]
MSRHRGEKESSPLSSRLEALNIARELAEERLPDETLAPVAEVLNRASTRRSLSAEHTVVGFFGATGSGKSSLFNAVAGQEVATAAARRPTTSEPLAGVWNPAGSEPLLDWLQVKKRHLMDGPPPSGRQDRGADQDGYGGLILLDLPDFDSTAVEHREIVERLAGQVDVLVWVLDPQKYADAALHQGFLRPLASYGAVSMVVLNQIDRLATREVRPVLDSLKQILAQDGLDGVAVFPASAKTGAGVEELRAAIRTVVDRRRASTERLLADIDASAAALADGSSGPALPAVPKEAKQTLSEHLAQSASVDVVAEAVRKSYRRHSHANTGWPVTRWLGKLRRDPLKRLNLDRRDVNPAVNRSSLPEPGPAQRAQADSAVRTFADAAGSRAPEVWRGSIRRAARASAPELPDALDQAMAGTDLGSNRKSWWWPVIGILQWIALAAAAAGALWLLGLAVLGYFQFEVPPAPRVEGFPVPTLLLVAGVLLGIVLGLASGLVARVAAASRAAKARRRLRSAVAQVAERKVVAPVEEEIRRYNSFRDALAAARGGTG